MDASKSSKVDKIGIMLRQTEHSMETISPSWSQDVNVEKQLICCPLPKQQLRFPPHITVTSPFWALFHLLIPTTPNNSSFFLTQPCAPFFLRLPPSPPVLGRGGGILSRRARNVAVDPSLATKEGVDSASARREEASFGKGPGSLLF